jgi:hypothetical protein
MPYLNNFPGAREAHEIYELFDNTLGYRFACRVCGCKWQRKPNHGKCAGVPIYNNWKDVPKSLYSETALYRDHKRKLPEGTLPIAAKRTEMSSFTPLYSLEQADPDWKTAKKKTKRAGKAEAPAPVSKETKRPEFKPFAFLDEVRKQDVNSE